MNPFACLRVSRALKMERKSAELLSLWPAELSECSQSLRPK